MSVPNLDGRIGTARGEQGAVGIERDFRKGTAIGTPVPAQAQQLTSCLNIPQAGRVIAAPRCEDGLGGRELELLHKPAMPVHDRFALAAGDVPNGNLIAGAGCQQRAVAIERRITPVSTLASFHQLVARCDIMHDQPSVGRLPTNALSIGTESDHKILIADRPLERAQLFAGLGIPNANEAVLVAGRGHFASIRRSSAES